MKKLLSIALILTICVSLFSSFGVYADEVKLPDLSEAQTDALEYLTAIELTDYTDAELAEPITRGEFVKLAAMAAGHNYNGTATSIFTDVAADNPNSPYINALSKAGIIGGFSDGSFKPDSTITSKEVVTILVRLLGYGYRAESQGGYPTGYLANAEQLELYDGIKNPYSDAVTKADALVYIMNALDTDIVEKTAYGSDERYEVRAGKTLAYNSYRIVHLEGIVEAVDISALKGDNAMRSWHFKVADKEVYVEYGNVWEYLGYSVDAYCVYDEDKDIFTLKWIKKTYENNEFVIDIDDIEDINNGKVTYFTIDTNKQKTHKYSLMGSVLFNGVSTNLPFNNDMLMDNGERLNGEVVFLDNDRDGVSDVIFVNAYYDIVVSGIDTGEYTIYDKFNNSKNIVVDLEVDDPYTNLFDASGTPISFEEIKVDDVLTVYESKSKSEGVSQLLYNVYKVNERPSGKIDSIGSVNNIITINGEKYEMTAACANEFTGKIRPGNDVTLLLNKAGEIAAFKFGSVLNAGVIMKAGSEKGLDGKNKVKILLQTGEIKTFDLADSVKIDDKVYKSGDASIITALKDASDFIYDSTYSTVKGGNITPYDADSVVQLVRYKTNENEEITFIDTVVSKYVAGVPVKATENDVVGDNALYMGQWGKNRYRGGVYLFGNKFTANTSTIPFAHPEMNTSEWDNEDDYKVLTLGNFVASNKVLHVTLPFYVNDDQLAASYILYEGSGVTELSETLKLSVVKKVNQVLVDDEIQTLVTVVGGSGVEELYFDADFEFEANSVTYKPESLQIGDVIRATTDFDGYVETLELYYRIQDGTSFSTIGTTADSDWYLEPFLLRLGYPYKYRSDGFTMLQTSVAPTKSDIAAADLTKVDYVPYYKSCAYIVYDDSHRDQTSWVTTGTYESILSYEAAGNDCVQVLVQAYVGRPEAIIIIKKGSDR